ncbi:hypothetical protein MTO96_025421 [Rhipicephalus appendiculatus]
MLYNGERINNDLLGRFNNIHTERMSVSSRGLPLLIEALIYKAPDSSCAIIMVRSLIQHQVVYLDLRGVFIAFNRTVLYRKQRISTDLLGQFSGRRKERMYIIRRGLTLSTETLFYKAPDSSCAVILFRSLVQNGSCRITKDIRGGVQHSSCGSDVYHVRRCAAVYRNFSVQGFRLFLRHYIGPAVNKKFNYPY